MGGWVIVLPFIMGGLIVVMGSHASGGFRFWFGCLDAQEGLDKTGFYAFPVFKFVLKKFQAVFTGLGESWSSDQADQHLALGAAIPVGVMVSAQSSISSMKSRVGCRHYFKMAADWESATLWQSLGVGRE